MAAIAVLWLVSTVASAQLPRVDPVYQPSAMGVQHDEKPPQLFAAKPRALTTLDAIEPPHGASNVVGTVRSLLAGETISAATGIKSFRSAGARRVRLHLRDVVLPSGAVMWVAGVDQKPIAFGAELLSADGEIWTPSVPGDTISIQGRGVSSSTVDAIGHLYPVAQSTACFRNAGCSSFPDKVALSASIGQMTFQRGTSLIACTGGLIVDDPHTNIYFLTANHCISTASEASSLEIAWDATESTCGANDAAARTKLTGGATLVATSAATDVTLLRLSSVPSGRWFMGWDTNPLATGTVLRRISHPSADNGLIFTQTYSATSVYGGTQICSATRPQFLYSSALEGGTGHGSSGAPVITDGGRIVGQLLGACGANPDDGCSSGLRTIDGSLASSFALLQPFLAPAVTTCSACTIDANTACVLNNRFKVTLRWRNAFANPVTTGVGTSIRYAENTAEVNPTFGPLSETVYFSMFPFAPKRVETVVKVFKGVGINDKYWVFAAGLTNNEYWVTVTDTQTCKTWERYNPHGQFGNLVDFEAFPFP